MKVNKYINGGFLIFYLLAYLLLCYNILPVNLNLLIRRGINFHDSAVQANIAVYSYNLIFILLISYWLIKYRLIISDKKFYWITFLFFFGGIVLLGAFMYSFKGTY